MPAAPAEDGRDVAFAFGFFRRQECGCLFDNRDPFVAGGA